MAKRIKRVLCDCDNTLGLQGRPMDDALALLYLLGREEDVDLLELHRMIQASFYSTKPSSI